MSEEKLSVIQKLANIREMVEVLRKNKKGHGYFYVTEDEILARVAAGMKKYGVSLIPSIVPGTLVVHPYQFNKSRPAKNGEVLLETVSETVIHAEMLFKWVNNDDASDFVDVPWVFIGQQGSTNQNASQVFGSALTYSNRYFMLKYFQIATPDDDPDSWREKKEEAAQEAEMSVLVQITDKIGAHISGYLDAHADKADEVRKEIATIVKKYVRNGEKPSVDYQKHLSDPEVAGKLLKALHDNFPIVDDERGED